MTFDLDIWHSGSFSLYLCQVRWSGSWLKVQNHRVQTFGIDAINWLRYWENQLQHRGWDVQIPDLASVRYYVRNSLPIFTKFCMRLRNVVA